jgi:hypothetical protein
MSGLKHLTVHNSLRRKSHDAVPKRRRSDRSQSINLEGDAETRKIVHMQEFIAKLAESVRYFENKKLGLVPPKEIQSAGKSPAKYSSGMSPARYSSTMSKTMNGRRRSSSGISMPRTDEGMREHKKTLRRGITNQRFLANRP